MHKRHSSALTKAFRLHYLQSNEKPERMGHDLPVPCKSSGDPSGSGTRGMRLNR
jgi:hypothetical protein